MNHHAFSFGMPYLLETKTVAEAMALAEELSLSFLELNTNFPSSQIDQLNPNYLLHEGQKRKLFFTLHLDDSISIADFNPFVRQAYLDTTLEAIDFCKKIQAPIINIHFAKGNIVTLPSGKNYLFEHYQEEFYENLINYREACEKAIGDSDVRVAIENTGGWVVYEQKGIELLLESPVFGLTMDIGHNHEISDMDLPFFERHANRLIHMHAHDGWDTTNHQALGTGEIPLDDRLQMAKDNNATVVLETKTIESLKGSIVWLKENNWL